MKKINQIINNQNQMRDIFRKLEKVILVVAIGLMSTAGIKAQKVSIPLSNGQNYTQNISLTEKGYKIVSLFVDVPSGTATISGIISGGTAKTAAITKTGAGTLILTGANTAAVNIVVDEGTLEIRSVGKWAEINVSSGATLHFSGKNVIPYVISGGGDVMCGSLSSKKGEDVVFTGINTYTGATMVSGCTLVLGNKGISGSIASSSGILLDTAVLDISEGNQTIGYLYGDAKSEVILGSRTLTITVLGTGIITTGKGKFDDIIKRFTKVVGFAGIFSGTGGVTKTGTGSFTMSGTHTATGTFTHAAGTVSFSGKWAGNYSKAAGTTLTVTGNPTIGGNLTLSGGNINMNLNSGSKITVTGSVTATGSNNLVITTSIISNYVLIQAASGITNTTPYTTAKYVLRAVGGNQLVFDALDAPTIPEITITEMPNGVVGTAYNENLIASGETPIAWTHEGGILPPGINLFQSGEMSGIPNMVGTYTFTVKASNSKGSDTKQLSIIIENLPSVPPSITTYLLPDGMIGETYNTTLTADGEAPITWSIISGNLPENLKLDKNTGEIYGTPARVETAHFRILAKNIAGETSKDLEITISSVGIKQLKMENGKLRIYPNPVKNQLTIDNGELKIENVEYVIYSVVGQVVQKNTPLNLPSRGEISAENLPFEGGRGMSEIVIDVSHLPAGMYFLEVDGKVVKFVKK